MNRQYWGTILNSNDRDYFTFTTEKDEDIKFSLTACSNEDMYIMLCNITDGEYIITENVTKKKREKFHVKKGKNYRLCILSDSISNELKYYFQFVSI